MKIPKYLSSWSQELAAVLLSSSPSRLSSWPGWSPTGSIAGEAGGLQQSVANHCQWSLDDAANFPRWVDFQQQHWPAAKKSPLCTGEENKWSWHSGADLLPLKSRWKIIPLCTASKWRFVWLVFTRVLCLTRNLKGIHLFREFVTTQPKICCLRSNHSPTTGWRLPDQALNQRASPWQTQSNAFPPLSHSSSAPLLNKSSLRNCIWGNQREGHLAHSAPSLDSRYTPTDPPWFWPSTLEGQYL